MKEIEKALVINTNQNVKDCLSINNDGLKSFFWENDYDNQGRQFYFTTEIIQNLEKYEDVFDSSIQVISIFEGIYSFLDRAQANTYFKIPGLYDFKNERFIPLRGNSYTHQNLNLDFNKLASKKNNLENKIYAFYEKIISSGVKDITLPTLFFLFSKPLDLRQIYQIYEYLKEKISDWKKNPIWTKYSSTINTFTWQANNFNSSGASSRHGKTRNAGKISQKPLTNIEVKNLICSITKDFLITEYQIYPPKYYGLDPERGTISHNENELF